MDLGAPGKPQCCSAPLALCVCYKKASDGKDKMACRSGNSSRCRHTVMRASSAQVNHQEKTHFHLVDLARLAHKAVPPHVEVSDCHVPLIRCFQKHSAPLDVPQANPTLLPLVDAKRWLNTDSAASHAKHMHPLFFSQACKAHARPVLSPALQLDERLHQASPGAAAPLWPPSAGAACGVRHTHSWPRGGPRTRTPAP